LDILLEAGSRWLEAKYRETLMVSSEQ
jgi:hypothetical protein